MENSKVTHEIKLSRPVLALLWGFVFALILNTLPSGTVVQNALAELSPNPRITLILKEGSAFSSNVDIDD